MTNVVQMKMPCGLPDGIDEETWNEFREYRKDIKRPMSDRAERMMLKKLTKLRDAGYDPNECMEQTMRTEKWWDVYPAEKIETPVQEKKVWRLSDSELFAKAKELRIGTAGKTRDQLVREVEARS